MSWPRGRVCAPLGAHQEPWSRDELLQRLGKGKIRRARRAGNDVAWLYLPQPSPELPVTPHACEAWITTRRRCGEGSGAGARGTTDTGDGENGPAAADPCGMVCVYRFLRRYTRVARFSLRAGDRQILARAFFSLVHCSRALQRLQIFFVFLPLGDVAGHGAAAPPGACFSRGRRRAAGFELEGAAPGLSSRPQRRV
jgi:hypothetical protein